jgi:hypothetical protein
MLRANIHLCQRRLNSDGGGRNVVDGSQILARPLGQGDRTRVTATVLLDHPQPDVIRHDTVVFAHRAAGSGPPPRSKLNLLLRPRGRPARWRWQWHFRRGLAHGALECLLDQVAPAHEPAAAVV